jgi:ABC-2 type transport system ATP-binding protein
VISLIEATSLVKEYRAVKALDDVSLKVDRGEIFGFFGPDGSGKTTMIRVLCGLTPITGGSAKVMGIDVRKRPMQVRENVAVMSEDMRFYEEMTPKKFLDTTGSLMLMPRTERLEALDKAAELTDITGFIDTRIAKLSWVQKQRVSLARVLMSKAPLLFLDEPFEGMDVVHRRNMRAYLKDFVKEGNTVFVASRSLMEADHLVDRFAFMHQGRIIATGTVTELKDKYLAPAIILQVSDPQMAIELIEKEMKLASIRIVEGDVSVVLQKRTDAPTIPKILTDAGIDIFEMRTAGSMEEVFERIARGEVA